jgi:hypothetical protein
MKRLLLGALLAMTGLASAEEGRPLTMETIDRVIERQDRAVQQCRRSGRRDTLAVQLRLEIDAGGQVTLVQPVDKASVESQCLGRVARRLHFPATGVTTRVDYPFMLLRR